MGEVVVLEREHVEEEYERAERLGTPVERAEVALGTMVQATVRAISDGAKHFIANTDLLTQGGGGAWTSDLVLSDIADYVSRRSIAMTLASRPRMLSKSLRIPWITTNPTVRQVQDSPAQSPATWGTGVDLVAHRVQVTQRVSQELLDDWAGLTEPAAIAILGRLYVRNLVRELDRLFMVGTVAGGDLWDGILTQAGVSVNGGATATADKIPAIVKGAAAPATAQGAWILGIDFAYAAAKAAVLIGFSPRSVEEGLQQITLAGAILGRPVVLVDQALLTLPGPTVVYGIFGDIRGACFMGESAPVTFEASGNDAEAWVNGSVAIRAYAHVGFAVVTPASLVKIPIGA